MDYTSAVTVNQNYGYLAVEVRASATYVGQVDPGDQHWQINTLLNHDRDNDSLANWSAPDQEGGSDTGFSITAGMKVRCETQPCTAYANLYRDACPSTYKYRGRGAVTVYHQFSPEIDTRDTGDSVVSCYDSGGGGGGGGGGGPDPCNNSTSTVSTVVDIDSGRSLARGAGGYPLERRDVQGQERFLLEEWAVVSVGERRGRTAEVEVVRASSPGFAGVAAARLRSVRVGQVAGPILLVDGVEHPRNGRHVPLPKVKLRSESAPVDTPKLTVVLRADFSPSGDLVDVTVLHADRPVSYELLSSLGASLELSYADSGRHRAIAFVVLELDGSVTLRSGQVVLPQCCCYSDETGIWCA